MSEERRQLLEKLEGHRALDVRNPEEMTDEELKLLVGLIQIMDKCGKDAKHED